MIASIHLTRQLINPKLFMLFPSFEIKIYIVLTSQVVTWQKTTVIDDKLVCHDIHETVCTSHIYLTSHFPTWYGF